MPGLNGQHFDALLHQILDKNRDPGLVHLQQEFTAAAFAQERLPLGVAELFGGIGRIGGVQLDNGLGRIEEFVYTSFDDLFSFIDDEHAAGDEFHFTEQMGGDEHRLAPMAAEMENKDCGYRRCPGGRAHWWVRRG